MTDKLPTMVSDLSWSRLNEVLLECDDLPILQRWLADVEIKTGSFRRSLRVYGRMATVRRVREIEAIKLVIKQRNKEKN